MKCPRCQTENSEGRKFCRKCGIKLSLICPECRFENLPEDSYCGECGYDFTKTSDITPQPIENPSKPTITDQERKYVTVMFSDLSGYTTMTEKLMRKFQKSQKQKVF